LIGVLSLSGIHSCFLMSFEVFNQRTRFELYIFPVIFLEFNQIIEGES
jgi:hypothetical protein